MNELVVYESIIYLFYESIVSIIFASIQDLRYIKYEKELKIEGYIKWKSIDKMEIIEGINQN